MVSKKMSMVKNRPKNGPISWDDAILYAEEQIALAQRRIAVLQGTVYVFRDRKQNGERFPGTSDQPSESTKFSSTT